MIFIILPIFLFGLIVGSFLNVLIDRLPNGQNPFQGRSHCDFCKKTLAPAELIPLLSFVVQKGRCRSCRKILSLQYPLIELVTGLMFVALFLYSTGIIADLQSVSGVMYQVSGSSLLLFGSLIFIFSSFLVIFVADVKYQLIPDEMVVSATIGSFFYVFLTGQLLVSSFMSGIGSAVFFGAIYLFTRGRGMGFGDVKLAFPLGLFLGFPGSLFAVYIAFLTGGFVSLILILLRKKHLKSKIAFGPFLITGIAGTFLWKNLFTDWYNGFFH